MSLGSTLCTQCGLCCTGALHNQAALEPGEAGFAAALGLQVKVSDKPRFALPCPKLKGCACSIYESRPAVCGRYKCQLLDNLENGLTDLPAALGKVRHAKGLIADLEGQLPAGMTLPEARVRYLGENERAEAGSSFMSLKLALTALCLYIDRHFKHDREGKFLAVEPTRSPPESLEME